MTKSDCGARTINLAKHGNLLKDRKLKIQGKEKPSKNEAKGGCTKPFMLPVGLTRTPLSAKRIRVCTGAELKRSCPKVVEKCKADAAKKTKVTPTKMFFKLLGLGMKCAVAGAFVYGSWAIGLWGDACQTEKLWLDMKSAMLNEACADKKQFKVPGCGVVSGINLAKTNNEGKDAWNRLVGATFGFIGDKFEMIDSYLGGEQPGMDNPNDCEDEVVQTKLRCSNTIQE